MKRIPFVRIDDQDEYERNEARANERGLHETCFICGRGLTEKAIERGWWVHLVSGGAEFAATDWEPGSDDDESGDMGWFPVGSECAKKVPRTFRQKEDT